MISREDAVVLVNAVDAAAVAGSAALILASVASGMYVDGPDALPAQVCFVVGFASALALGAVGGSAATERTADVVALLLRIFSASAIGGYGCAIAGLGCSAEMRARADTCAGAADGPCGASPCAVPALSSACFAACAVLCCNGLLTIALKNSEVADFCLDAAAGAFDTARSFCVALTPLATVSVDPLGAARAVVPLSTPVTFEIPGRGGEPDTTVVAVGFRVCDDLADGGPVNGELWAEGHHHDSLATRLALAVFGFLLLGDPAEQAAEWAAYRRRAVAWMYREAAAGRLVGNDGWLRCAALAGRADPPVHVLDLCGGDADEGVVPQVGDAISLGVHVRVSFTRDGAGALSRALSVRYGGGRFAAVGSREPAYLAALTARDIISTAVSSHKPCAARFAFAADEVVATPGADEAPVRGGPTAHGVTDVAFSHGAAPDTAPGARPSASPSDGPAPPPTAGMSA